MPESPLILVIDDEYLLQVDVEAVLTDGGFVTEMMFSGDEALALLMNGNKSYRALVADVNLGQGCLDGREVAKADQGKRTGAPRDLLDGLQ